MCGLEVSADTSDESDKTFVKDLTGYKTPAQRLEAAHTRIDKLTDEVGTLQRVLAAQNQATASIQREWRRWSDALLRIHTPEGIDASKWLATLST